MQTIHKIHRTVGRQQMMMSLTNGGWCRNDSKHANSFRCIYMVIRSSFNGSSSSHSVCCQKAFWEKISNCNGGREGALSENYSTSSQNNSWNLPNTEDRWLEVSRWERGHLKFLKWQMISDFVLPKILPALNNKSIGVCLVDCVDDNPSASPHIVQTHRVEKTREKLLKVVC